MRGDLSDCFRFPVEYMDNMANFLLTTLFKKNMITAPKNSNIAELRNDYEDITETINQNIQVLHSAKLAPSSTTAKDSSKSMILVLLPLVLSSTLVLYIY